MQYGQKTPEKKKIQKELSIDDASQNLDDIFLYNYDMYRKTLDLNWLIKTYTGKEKKLDAALLMPVEENINRLYYNAIADDKTRIRIEKTAKVQSLVSRYDGVTPLIKIVAKGFEADIEDQERRVKFIMKINEYMDSFKIREKLQIMAEPFEDLIKLEKISNILQGVKTQVAIIMDELKDEGKKESLSLNKQLLIVGVALNTGYAINSRKTTVQQWIEYGELMAEKAAKN